MVFSTPAEVCALQCALSTKTAPSSLSVWRQKCCAATLPTAVWLSVAEHLCVPCWLTEPRTTQPQDQLSFPVPSKWAERCKTHLGAADGTKCPALGLKLWKNCGTVQFCFAKHPFYNTNRCSIETNYVKRYKSFWKCVLFRVHTVCVTPGVPSIWNMKIREQTAMQEKVIRQTLVHTATKTHTHTQVERDTHFSEGG